MKVVLFCGGMGMRLREHTGAFPKPMVKIGYRPILWHLMKYYAHFGHTEFILCLGWKGDAIKEYFLNYDECLSNDFVLSAVCLSAMGFAFALAFLRIRLRLVELPATLHHPKQRLHDLHPAVGPLRVTERSGHQSSAWFHTLGCGWAVAQRAMRPGLTVSLPPRFHEHLGLP